MSYKYGIVVGKFAPLTFGHINLINEALSQCHRVLIVLSHDWRWLAKQSPRDQRILTWQNRFRWLTQTYGDCQNIEFTVIDEKDIPEFPNGWGPYCDLLLDRITDFTGDTLNREDVAIFSSEDSYDAEYQKYLPVIGHVVVDNDRSQFPISATMVREHLYEHWGYLPSVVRRDYALKVLVTGLESVGKSTVCKNLARLFGTSWVEEYGRVYCETVLAGKELTLRSDDYPIIAYQHKTQEQRALATANKVMFVDTGAFSTEFFHRLYEGRHNPVVTAIAMSEHWDLVLHLSAEVPWVADGLRCNEDRTESQRLWNEMCCLFPNQFPEDRTVWISGGDYGTRWQQAKNAVLEFMAKVEAGEY